MMRKYISILSFIICYIGLSQLSINESNAQILDEKFGRNSIQYRFFNWKYYSTPHFEIYYYPGGQKLAKELTVSLEDDHEVITDLLGYAPYAKTKIFLYNNNLELNQSNVGLGEANFTIAGQTNFLKNQIQIAFGGSLASFNKELRFLVAKSYVNDMLFGGFISEVFSSSYIFTIPEWFTEGIASYIAYGWDAEMDDFVREFLVEENVSKIVKLEDESARLAGQSIWNYIAEKYGRISISSVLNLTRIIRNEEKSISNSLGIGYTQFLRDYRNFYLSNQVENTVSLPDNSARIAKSFKNDIAYKSEISPNGEWLAYSINKRGKFKVYLKNLASENKELLLRGGIKRLDHKAYEQAPVFSWGDSTTLGIVDYENGVNILKTYNPYTDKWKLKSLRKFEQINYLDIYPNGKTAVISVNVKGQSDLYLMSIDKPNSRRLTNDLYDDLYPNFINDTKKIIFSSNRPDSVSNNGDSYSTIQKDLNLFTYDIEKYDDAIQRLTNDLGNNTQPISVDSTTIIYLSDKSGIRNLYQYDLNTQLQKQISAYPTGIENYSVNSDAGILSFSAYDNQRIGLYLTDFNRDSEPKFLMSTFRKQIELSRQINLNNNQSKKISVNNNSALSALSDSISIDNAQNVDSSELTSKLDADDFNFESNDFIARSKQSSLLKNLSKLRKTSSVAGPLDYEPSFEVDNVTISFLFDPLFGFSPFVDYQMNDLLENNKFSGGVAYSVFNQARGSANKFYGEYQYLSRLVDYSLRFDRKSMSFNIEEGAVEQKYSLNELQLGFAMPFSTSLRASFQPTIGFRTFVETGNTVFGGSPLAKSAIESEFLYGGKLNIVYDNSEVLGFNIRQGSRAKISFENYNFNGNFSESFYKFTVDLRHYQKIYNEITFATKLYAGSFFGNNAPSFLLGGVDNWATLQRAQNIRSETTANGDPSSNPLAVASTLNPYKNNNLLFHEFVTGLRGFRINELNGRKTLLLSSELRIPLFRALSSSAIKSAFLRNFQLLGFYDIGTAWNGGNPWDSDNSINTEIIERPTFKAVIQNYKNPWLSSTGVGMSTVLFGYYGTIYYAFPIEDYKFKDPTILIGLGYNF